MLQVFEKLLRKKLSLELVPSLTNFTGIKSWHTVSLVQHPAHWSGDFLPQSVAELPKRQVVFINDAIMIAVSTVETEPGSALVAVLNGTDCETVAVLCTAKIPLQSNQGVDLVRPSQVEAALVEPGSSRLYLGGATLKFVMALTDSAREQLCNLFIAQHGRPPTKEESFLLYSRLGVQTELDAEGRVDLKLNQWPAFLRWAYLATVAPIAPNVPLLLEACSTDSLSPKFFGLLK